MPWSALPEHLDSPEKWKGTDWDNPWQRWLLKFKGWLAYGPRAKEWWARWREIPITLLALNCSRIVHSDGSKGEFHFPLRFIQHPWNTKELTETGHYPAIIQYWKRWSLNIQWPLHIALHIFWKKPTILKYPETRDFKISEMFYFRCGARRDQDKVYWFPSLFIGGDFN